MAGDATDPARYFLDDEPYTLTDAQWTTVAGVTVSGRTTCGAPTSASSRSRRARKEFVQPGHRDEVVQPFGRPGGVLPEIGAE